MGPRKSEQFRSNWWGKTYADNTNRVAIKSLSFPSGWVVGQMAPWIDHCLGCPKSPLGPKQANLAPANPCAEPAATPANENTKPFQIPPGWPCKKFTRYGCSSSFSGFRDPCAFPLAPWMRESRDFFMKSPSSSRGLGLPQKQSSLLATPRQGARSSSPFPARIQALRKRLNPRLRTEENAGRPEKQVILRIPFPKEGVESLVRFGRKAMEKRKELFQT